MPADTVLEIDIATRVVGPTEDFHIVRPGKGFTLYQTFDRQSVVSLDFPDLDLEAFAAAPRGSVLRRELAQRSAIIRQWHLGKRKLSEPARDIESYKGRAYKAQLGKHIASIERLYFQLEPGTIIIVPPPSPYDDVLIGVLEGGTETISNVAIYPGEAMPVRRVRWLGRRAKGGFSASARERLDNPNPLIQLDRTLREEFLRAAYDQFVIGDNFTARFRTEADEYSSLDDEDITSFVNYIAGLIAHYEENGDAERISAAEAAALLRELRDRVPELSVNISSPGFLRLLSARVDPVTIAAFMALAMSGATPAAGQTIKVVNSAAGPQDPCALVVSKQAEGAMTIMNFDETKVYCDRLRGAASHVRLRSSMKVKTKNSN